METKHCPRCGRLLPPRAPAGLCPACLIAQGAETDAGGPPTPPFQPPPIAEIAKLFPQLEVISLLGAGGMGAVYKARQPSLDRFVALKILPATNTSGVNFAERFNREARALARLSHPNIVAVHEFGQANGLHYFIMEFVDGANLRQLEQASRLAPREALQIIPQICDALQYAHDEGVVHRDIKPENVLIDRKGRVKIADFGLAKILGRDAASARLTLEGQVMGTPHYMAPEQIERPLAVDHRADIYSLGVVFYEMLTGDLPLGKFAAPSRKVRVDVRFDEVVLRALENDPSRRYQKASEVKSEVETIAETPPPPTQGRRYHGWVGFPLVAEEAGHRRIHWKGVLIAFALVLGLITIAFGFVTAITGRSLFGWIGVVGWPSLVARILISAALVAWGLSRALRARSQAETLPSRRIILPSLQLPWKFARYLIVALVLAAVLWRVPLHTLVSKLTTKRSVTLAQIATRDAKTGVLRAQLPGRGTVELLAVGETNSVRGGWWAPDGTILTNADYEVPAPVENSHSGRISKDLLLRIRDLPSGASIAGIRSEPDSGLGSGGSVFRDGKPLSGAFQARLAFKPPLGSANIQVGFGLDAWRTIGTISADGRSQNQTRRTGDPNWKLQFHHDPIDTAEGAQVAVLFGPGSRMWVHQFVAVDTNGVERSANSSQGTPIEGVTLWTYRFRGLHLAELKEFRAQVRPVHWVEFSNIALEPRGAIAPPQPRQFGPVVERTFTGVIDFDTGLTTNRFDSVATLTLYDDISWMRENGFDSALRPEGLQPFDMDFVALQLSDWDTLSATELRKRVYGNYYRPPILRSDVPVFGFRTREHGVGMLRLVKVSNATERSATVHYKLVQRGPLTKIAKNDLTNTQALNEPPKLRFLAWQDEWSVSQPAAWLPDGSPMPANDVDLLRQLPPAGLDVSATQAGKRQPRFLHLWFSHPLIDRNGLNEVKLYHTNGKPLQLGADSSIAARVLPAEDRADHTGWYMCTLSPGERMEIPDKVAVRFRYVIGPLERVKEVPSDYSGGMSLEGNAHLNGIGQDSQGNSFVALAMPGVDESVRHFGVIAVTRDRRDLAALGSSTTGHARKGGVLVEKFHFNMPLSEIASFRIGTRLIRTTGYNVVLRSDAH